MTLSNGHPVIAIPGPSPVPDAVLRAMHRASPDIYGEELAALNLGLMARLKALAGTGAHLAAYIGNGHAGWEAANANLFAPGDRVLALTSGHFGRGWVEVTRAQGIEVEVLDFGRAPPEPARLAERLAADAAGTIRAVLVCQIDTASSAQADIEALRQAMGAHPALLVVDAIASLGCAPMRMDDCGVDVLIAASQKGLMCPPGCVFLWFSDRAARAARGPLTPWWDWTPRAEGGPLWRCWGGTPPVQHLYGLTAALDLIETEGLEAVWARHAALAEAVWAAFEAWGEGHPDIALTVAPRAGRAASVTAAAVPQADALRAWLATRTGVTLGVGLGAPDPTRALRVAHMGHAHAAMILGVLASMEAGMGALAIPRGRGALDAAARVIAARA